MARVYRDPRMRNTLGEPAFCIRFKGPDGKYRKERTEAVTRDAAEVLLRQKVAGIGEESVNLAVRIERVLGRYKKSDEAVGWSCDLDFGFLQAVLKAGCLYCGLSASWAVMTLDRIDNTLGHTKANVVPACLYCNLTRGTTPYPVWVFLAVRYREARRLGLLDLHDRFTRKVLPQIEANNLEEGQG